jgi:hypothetical protein
VKDAASLSCSSFRINDICFQEIVEGSVELLVHHWWTADPYSSQPLCRGDGVLLICVVNIILANENLTGILRLHSRFLSSLLYMAVSQEVSDETLIPPSEFLTLFSFARNTGFEYEVSKTILFVEGLDSITDIKSDCTVPVRKTNIQMEHEVRLEPVEAL